ncbi:hypothetical protein Rhopal_003993-T1 [Rhodotorula paludigena]|uniref:Uncharacterized protein n=1 Tax=Rhodotorula paludigena TaxID=86838 RepID=A0AAV5GP00_9BASI|nr:hypothetical protein Rhopal_003993-T1 [Rhodotorula paludigena]
MSAPPSKFWPSVGSKWQHWSDLLLATQLAALRAGFNYVGRSWDALTGYREMHNIEGSLKGRARTDGRFLGSRLVGISHDYILHCVLHASRCNFFVRLRPMSDVVDDGPTWRCLEIRSEHTCESHAKKPQDRLQWRIDFFDNQPAVLVLSDSSDAEPAASASTAANPSASASSRRIDTLRTDLAAAQTELNSASAAVDELKADLAAAEKLVEVQRKRVEKREKRLQRAVEKAERKKNKVKEGGRKKDKGKKKDKAEKEKGKAGRA